MILILNLHQNRDLWSSKNFILFPPPKRTASLDSVSRVVMRLFNIFLTFAIGSAPLNLVAIENSTRLLNFIAWFCK